MKEWLKNKYIWISIVGVVLLLVIAGIVVATNSSNQVALEKEEEIDDREMEAKKEEQNELDETDEVEEKEDKEEVTNVDEKQEEEKKEEEKEENIESDEKEKNQKEETRNSDSSSVSNATVKVEKSSNQTTSSSSSNTTANESTAQKTESKPASKPEPKITTKTTTSTESIAYKTIEKNDASLEKGQTKVSQNGKNGVRTITYKETYKDGKLVSKEQTSSKVTTNPVDKIIAIGTKAPAPTKLSSADANSILGGSGMSNSGGQYTLETTHGRAVSTKVGSDGVSLIYFNPTYYLPYKYATKEELIDAYGKEQGMKEYEAVQKIAKQIETAVRASANAVYGSGTSKANQLYNQIIGSQSAYEKSF